ncbi:class I SAM-dependent methyltransferase [Prochlorothrix hollandica]|uniref:class I SAM-dependent methyltransferase n=1 Tax=Prochlorothrix hollandica TaxID=1223 RepID=UPI00333F345D
MEIPQIPALGRQDSSQDANQAADTTPSPVETTLQTTLQALQDHLQQQPQQRLTFADYMDWALYDPAQGYYSQRVALGQGGDFFTSAHLGPDFGQLLAVQFQEMWQVLGQPQPFTLVEMGAGEGLLAADILAYLEHHDRPCFEALHYGIVERSPRLRHQQRQTLAPWVASDPPALEQPGAHPAQTVQWYTWDQLTANPIVGCCFSNELVDAFPVHQVVATGGQLREVYVTWDHQQHRPVEVLGDLSTPALAAYFADLGLNLTQPPYGDGYRTEVNLAAQDWLTTVAQGLQRGYVLTLDYGYGSDRYYQPSRAQGTLQAYRRHRHHNEPYQAPGHQDLTAHVNFTALEQWGDRQGLRPLGFVPQALFLMALGLGDRLAALSNPATAPPSLPDLLQRRDALHQLLDMSSSGLGNFGVLLQGKGLSPAEQGQTLRGWQEPV